MKLWNNIFFYQQLKINKYKLVQDDHSYTKFYFIFLLSRNVYHTNKSKDLNKNLKKCDKGIKRPTS